MAEQLTETRFWMVWSPQGRAPMHKHRSRAYADREAERLARVCPGQQFFVLKAMSGFTVPTKDVQMITLTTPDGDGLPF